ncbi:MAG: TfoX/Sxy family protein [Steroidobacteraceae bacterium]
MAVSEGYRSYVLEQLGALTGVRTRRMFGGVGIYAGEAFFALIDDDVLYFKVDDSIRAEYEARGMRRFRPYPDRPEASLGYYEVPADVIEEAEELARWARRSIEVAQRSAEKKRKTPSLAQPDGPG